MDSQGFRCLQVASNAHGDVGRDAEDTRAVNDDYLGQTQYNSVRTLIDSVWVRFVSCLQDHMCVNSTETERGAAGFSRLLRLGPGRSFAQFEL